MKALVLAILAAGIAPAAVSSQSATRSHTHPLGWSFSVPEGWRVQDLERASALAPPDRPHDIKRADQGHVYAVTAFGDIPNPEDADLPWRFRRTLAHNGFEPLGTPSRETLAANGRSIVLYTWSFQPRRRAAFMETRLYLVPDQARKVTVVLVAASERDLLAPKNAELLQLASSLTFGNGRAPDATQWTDWGFVREKPPGPGMPDPGAVLADESVPSQQWFFYLRGKRIAPAPGGPAGPASNDPRQALDLREDGTFVNVPSGRGTAAGSLRGRWRIVTRAGVTALVLYWEGSAPTYHRLERRDNVILVDDVASTVSRPG